MNNIVLKFGGTSLATAKNFLKVKEIIEKENPRFVVVSAPGKRFKEDEKLTDILIDVYKLKEEKGNYIKRFCDFENRIIEIAKELNVFDYIKKDLYNIRKNLKNSEKDYIISRGEYLSMLIMSKLLNYEYIDAKDFIKFKDNKLLEKNFLLNKTKKNVPYIVPGFYGEEEGKIKVFSRGGSDITGAIVSKLINAKVYKNYTDVDGVFQFDPKYKKGKIIKNLSYKEIRSLSYFGASVIHEDTSHYLEKNNIKLVIKNTFNEMETGTKITCNSNKFPVGVSILEDIYVYKLSSFNLFKDFYNIFRILKDKTLFYFVSLDNLTIISKNKDLYEKLKDLSCEIQIFKDFVLMDFVGSKIEDTHTFKRFLNKITKFKIEGMTKNILDFSVVILVKKEDAPKIIEEIF